MSHLYPLYLKVNVRVTQFVQIESTKMVLGTLKTCSSSVDDAPISEKGDSE